MEMSFLVKKFSTLATQKEKKKGENMLLQIPCFLFFLIMKNLRKKRYFWRKFHHILAQFLPFSKNVLSFNLPRE